MSSIKILAEQFSLNTRLFNNVLEGIEDVQGNKRVNEEVNHLQWIAGHITNARYNYSAMLGLETIFEYKELYVDPTAPPPGNRAIDPKIKYPSLSKIAELWNELALSFVDAISKVSDEQAVAVLPFGTPINDNSFIGFFGFLLSHESYHIGQMSLIRKYLGLGAMSYK
ncbi:MAG TPA: DinB family protein [Puia sp.]|nr:DinB family protein [Puia sp.]